MRLDPREIQEIWLAGFGVEGACGRWQFYIFSLHSSGTRHLCSSHFLAAVNVAAVTLGMPMFSTLLFSALASSPQGYWRAHTGHLFFTFSGTVLES